MTKETEEVTEQENVSDKAKVSTEVEDPAKTKLEALAEDNKRMRGALQKLQEATKAKDAEVAKLKEEQERAKMSEEEKRLSDVAKIRDELAVQRAENEKLLAENAVERQLSDLVALGLKNRRFGKEVLSEYDSDTDGTLAEFVDKIKVKEEWSGLFKGSTAPRAKAPNVPGGGGGRDVVSATALAVKAAAEEKAHRIWPRDPARREAFINRQMKGVA